MAGKEVRALINVDTSAFEGARHRAAELTAGLDRAVLVVELDAARREIIELQNELEVSRRHAVPCECRGGTPGAAAQ